MATLRHPVPSGLAAGDPKLRLSVSVDPRGFVLATVVGRANLAQGVGLLQDLLAHPHRTDCKWLLLDLLGVSGELQLHERFDIGVATASHLSGFSRIAIVQTPRADNGFGALVARNRGTNVSMFDSIDAAIDWLSMSNEKR